MNVEVTAEQLLTIFGVVFLVVVALIVFSAIMFALERKQQADDVTEKQGLFTGPYDSDEEFNDGAKL